MDTNGTCSPACLASQIRDPVTNVCTSPPGPTQAEARAEKNNAPPQCPAGNPCNPANGNKYQSESDYVGGEGVPTIVRAYNSSLSGKDFGLGFGWIWMAGKRLEIYSSLIQVRSGDGRGEPFTKNTAGLWIADADSKLTLVQDASGYTLTRQDDSVERYDTTGKLTAETSRNNRTTSYSYNSAGKLATITGPFGQSPLTIAYGADGRISSITDPAGAASVYAYAYDTAGNLSRITYPDGRVRTYLYGEAAHVSATPNTGVSYAHTLTGIVDENGNHFASWTYDAAGRATSSEHASFGSGIDKVSLAYTPIDANGNTTTSVTDPLGTARTYTFSTILGAIKSTGITQPAGSGGGGSTASSTMTYDANGNVASRTDFNGNRTNYTYDLTRNLELSRTEAAGTPQARTIETTWHSSYRLPLTMVEKNASGAVLRSTSLTYDSSGNLIQRTLTTPAGTGTTQTTRTTSYTYNSVGQMLTLDGPRVDVSDLTTFTYYPNTDADPGKRSNLASITNALGHITRITGYNAHGQPLTLIDPNGVTTTLTYDARLRLTSRNIGGDVGTGGGIVGGETTTYTYDGVGQLTRVTLPDSSYLDYSYDAAHRLTRVSDSLGNQISYTLDALGNRLKEDLLDPAGALAQTRSRVYDSLNRLSRDIGAQNQTTQYAYDPQGNLTTVTDALNRVTSNAYDALNRLTQMTDPNLGQSRYGYNALDQMTSVTDPRNLVTSYTYDGLNNLNQLTSPDTGVTINTYDAAGNLLTQTDAKGQTTTYTYDTLNRVTRITYADAQTIGFQYDQSSSSNGIGRLTQVTDATGVTSYSYDRQGRVVTVTEARTPANVPNSPPATPVTYVTTYRYDSAGRLAQITYPSGRQVAYTLDGLGRISQITTSFNGVTQVVASNVTYRPFNAGSSGGITGFTFGNGQPYARGFDTDGRITTVSQGNQTLALGYDAASRIGFLSDTTNPANTASFGYDALDRLTSMAAPASSQSFGYDAVGNRTSKTVGTATSSYAYAASSNRLIGVMGSITAPAGANQTMNYDANGALINDGVKQFSYDARGRLIQVNTVQGTNQYQINALGQRIKKSSGNSATVFHYDQNGRLLAESDSAGRVQREYVYLNDLPVAVIQAVTP